MTLQKWAGCVISALSVYVIVSNSIRYQDLDSLLSILLGSGSLVFFGISIFIESIYLKAIQCIMFFIVSVYAVTSETDPVLMGIGFFFMLVGFELFMAYRFIDKNPIPVIIGSLIGIFLFFSLIFRDFIMSAVSTLGVASGFAILWAIRFYVIKELMKIAKEALKYGDEFKQVIEERTHDGEIH